MDYKKDNVGVSTCEMLNSIADELETANALQFAKKDLSTYKRLISNINKGFSKASDAYILIACNLYQIHINEYFRIDNYKSIADFCMDMYGLKKSTTHNYIKVIQRFGLFESEKPVGIKDAYKDYSCSQLVAMVNFTPEQLEGCNCNMSVRQLLEYGRSSLSCRDDVDKNNEGENINDSAIFDNTSVSNSPINLPTPEINDGRVFIAEIKDFKEFESRKNEIETAYINMVNDDNFKSKNVRLVIEIAYD